MDNIEVKKLDDYTLEVTTTPPAPDPVVQTYDRGFLEQQLKDIQKQKDDFDAERDTEIAQVQKLLDLCDQQGVITKPIEQPAPVEKIVPLEPAPVDPLPDEPIIP